jgi:hypothetical protein
MVRHVQRPPFIEWVPRPFVGSPADADGFLIALHVQTSEPILFENHVAVTTGHPAMTSCDNGLIAGATQRLAVLFDDLDAATAGDFHGSIRAAWIDYDEEFVRLSGLLQDGFDTRH